jgi:hypothetical protein
MRRLAGNLALVCLGILGGVLTLEVALRLAGFGPIEAMPDETIGFRYVPHEPYRRIGEGGSSGRFNGAGWRDVEHAEAKPPGTTRILILGDSYVAAFQVPLATTFFRRLERALNARATPGRRFEVIAFGEDACGTAPEYLAYETWGVRYDPDVVAVLFIPNDQADNWRPSAPNKGRPFFVESADSLKLDTSFNRSLEFTKWKRMSWIRTHSAAWAQVHRALSVLRAPFELRLRRAEGAEEGYYEAWNYDPRVSNDSLVAARVTAKALVKFARAVARDGRRFVVFVAGFPMQEDRELLPAKLRDPFFDPEKTPRWLGGIGEREGFDVVPLSPAFREASARLGRPLWFRNPGGYGHWNAAGHAVAARAMQDYLARVLPGLDTTGSGRQASAAAAAPDAAR